MRLRCTRLSLESWPRRSFLPLDSLPSAAAYSLRKLRTDYAGEAIRVRRSSDNAEQDIGFDAVGDLDLDALTLFCGAPRRPLLSIAGASAAYSLRRLGDYSGPAIRVRRSSDNAEQDIGFTTAGDLDLAALLAFVGVNSGFVTVWYDQSGFARNATQTTAALQPRIVNAGVVDTLNGRPSIYFSGTDLSNSTRLIAPTSGVVAQPFSISLVTQATPSACVFFFSPQVTLEGATSSIFLFAGSVLNVPGTLTSSPMVLGATYSGAGSSLRKDGAVAGSGNAGAAVPSSICIGARNDTLGRSINGQIPEMLVFPTNIDLADRQNLERSQGAYYNITVT